MAQIIVRKLEDAVVQRLREEAAREGVSAEEAARRILRRSLLKEEGMSFKEFLLTMPDLNNDSLFDRPQSTSSVDWSQSPAVVRDRTGARVLSAEESLEIIHDA